MRAWLIVILFFALFVGTIIYWIAVFALTDLDTWLGHFPYISPLADIWMAGTGGLAALGLIKGRRWGVCAGYLSAGSCIMIAITAFHYNLHTGQIFDGTLEQVVEICIPTALLLLGILALGLLPAASRRNDQPGGS